MTTQEERHDPVFEEKDGGFEKETELKPDDESEADEIRDLFSPLPPLKGVQEEQAPLTIRSVTVGVVLGTLVNASNVYLGEFQPSRSAPPTPAEWLRAQWLAPL